MGTSIILFQYYTLQYFYFIVLLLLQYRYLVKLFFTKLDNSLAVLPNNPSSHEWSYRCQEVGVLLVLTIQSSRVKSRISKFSTFFIFIAGNLRMLPNKEYLLLMSEPYQLNTVLKMIVEISIKVCLKQKPAFPLPMHFAHPFTRQIRVHTYNVTM